MARSVPLAGAVLLAVLLGGCDGPAPVAAPLSARSRCALHLKDVRQAELGTVGGIRQIGPQLNVPPPSPLDAYADDEPIALCLVPDDTGGYAAVALILADGVTVSRWGQNTDSAFIRPS